MFFSRMTLPAFSACTLLLVAGCSPSAPMAPSEGSGDSSPVVAEERAVTLQTPESAAPDAKTPPETTPVSEPPSGGGAPVESPLPEVRAVNTAELDQIMEKTRGKVTVLNFWATWCLPCVQEMPDFVTLYNESDLESFALVSLSIDDVAEVSGAIPEFQRTHKMPFPIYVLNERNDEALLKAVRGKFNGMIPTTFIYDKSGALVKMVEGSVTLAELRELLKPLLAPSA